MAHNEGLLKQTAGDLALLFPGQREKRLTDWRKHVNVFAELKAARPDATPEETRHAQASARIEFLADHLRVLDAKFASLLQFQALLMIAAGILNVRYLNQKLPSDSVVPLVALILLVFSTTILCLLGAGWFFWGEMSGTPVVDKAEEHVGGMIRTVMKRTAIFRYAWMLTFITVGVFLYFVGSVNDWFGFGSLVQTLQSLAAWSGLLTFFSIVSVIILIVVACFGDESERKKWQSIIVLGTVSFVLQLLVVFTK
jgi:hypothetical protein